MRRTSPHLVRAPAEPTNRELQAVCKRLLEILKSSTVREGEWRLLECLPAWEGNGSWDDFIAFEWRGRGDKRLLVAVNFAPHPSQCFVRIPGVAVRDADYRLVDLTGPARYDRSGKDLATRGLYLDMGAWQYHVFEVTLPSGTTRTEKFVGAKPAADSLSGKAGIAQT